MRLLRFLMTMLLLALLTAGSLAAAGEPEAKPLLIDVRTPAEWQEGHLEGAFNIPYEKIGAEIGEVAPDKKARINLYCRSGRRSGIALETLQKLGYENATNYGTINEAAEKLKLPVVK